jgi:hypothetical protein
VGNRQELVIYGGKLSGSGYLRWETVSCWPGWAGLTDLLGLIIGGHFLFISQIANVVCGEIGA